MRYDISPGNVSIYNSSNNYWRKSQKAPERASDKDLMTGTIHLDTVIAP